MQTKNYENWCLGSHSAYILHKKGIPKESSAASKHQTMKKCGVLLQTAYITQIIITSISILRELTKHQTME